MAVILTARVLDSRVFGCRHVMLPKEIVKLVPKNHLMTEEEWRGIGVQQSQGWQHYMHHGPGRSQFAICVSSLVYGTETVQVTPLRRTLASSP